MALCVLNYPGISNDDFNWIQALRAEHDGLYYRVVAPHFTFVFPVSDIDQTVFIRHIKQQTTGFKRFSFALRYAIIVEDDSGEYTHVFLVPDEGYSSIIRLHDRLYSGVLAPEHRLDIPFIPHLGIGNDTDPNNCKRLVDELNRKDFCIQGTIDTLDVVEYDGSSVRTIEQIKLD